ncbi:MAG: biotin--[acetyl-CoA-carboxylase] ligase [Chloroflexota bacterium]
METPAPGDAEGRPGPLDWRRVLRDLHTRHVAATPGTFVYLPASASTNSHARTLAGMGAPHGTVVLADDQTAGRGRMGRSWSVPPRTGLTLSIILRQKGTAPRDRVRARAPEVVMATAVAVHDLARLDLEIAASLKWPNDLLVAGRKACGILVESAGPTAGGDALVVGIGLNVNASPRGLEDRATCLAAARGAALDRETVLRALLRRLDSIYDVVESGGAGVRDRWRAALETLGRPVVVYLPTGDVLRGYAEDVTGDGALQVRDGEGRLQIVYAADVSLSPPPAPTPGSP